MDCGFGGWRSWWTAALAAALAVGGCDCGGAADTGGSAGRDATADGWGGGGGDGGGGSDGGAATDGGTGTDGGGGLDGGTGPDGGSGLDGGSGADGGAGSDGGSGSDGGTGADGGADGSADAGSEPVDPCGTVEPLAFDPMVTLGPTTSVSSDGILLVTGAGPGPASRLDVRDVLRGGLAPLRCRIYRGEGQGTVPEGVAVAPADEEPSGCVLLGGPGPMDPPGTYGFFVQVTDACGTTVEVPVAYRGRPCDDGRATITPGEWPPLVIGAGQAHRWTVTAAGQLDSVALGSGSCARCGGWWVESQAPLTGAPNMDCSAAGDWCVECPADGCLQYTSGCGVVGDVVTHPWLREHSAVRGPERPAWIHMAFDMEWSGDSISPCGGKEWACHIDVFERASGSAGP